jgi:hypothetical protein
MVAGRLEQAWEGQMAGQLKFEEFVEQERTRLDEAREAALQRVKEAKAELKAIDDERRAIAAYEAAKAGKEVTIGGRATRAVKPGGEAPTRKRDTGRQKRVLKFLRDNLPEGGSRAKILAEMNITGEKKKKAEAAVSQALAALAKAGKIAHEGKGRGSKYVPLTGDDTLPLHSGDF